MTNHMILRVRYIKDARRRIRESLWPGQLGVERIPSIARITLLPGPGDAVQSLRLVVDAINCIALAQR